MATTTARPYLPGLPQAVVVAFFIRGRFMDYSRKINLIGDVDEAMYLAFVESLDGMCEIDTDPDITVELSSHGGDAMIAVALFERIRLHKGTVTIKAIGPIFSAAVLILAAGDVRIMSKNSWVMLHEDLVAVSEDSRVSQAEIDIKNARLLEDQWNRLLSSVTNTNALEWAKLHEKECYLNADRCKVLGLIDKVV